MTALLTGRDTGRLEIGSRLLHWLSAVHYLYMWLPAAAMAIHIKYTQLQLPGSAMECEGPALAKLSFYRVDLLWVLVLIPIALFVTVRFLPRPWCVAVIAAASSLISIFSFAEVKALWAIGGFLSLPSLRNAVWWGWHHTDIISTYLPPRSFLRLIAVLIVIGCLGWLAIRQDRVARPARARRTRLLLTAAPFWVLALISGLAWLPSVPETSFHKAALTSAVAFLFGESDIDTREYDGLTPAALTQRYRELTGSCPRLSDPRYFGKAAGDSVLFFIFETGPARALALDKDIDDLPSLRRLRANSLVALKHHTTFAFTQRATWSLFSSWYPSNLPREFTDLYPDLSMPSSLVCRLASSGYSTALFSALHGDLPGERKMYEALGFQKQVYADRISKANRDVSNQSGVSDRIDMDRKALEALKLHIVENERFVAAYFPQLGHGPVPNMTGSPGLDTPGKIRSVLRKQDAWLGELLDVLDSENKLARTLIVVTSDHGVRTLLEDPNFQPGMVDDYTYHVPFLLYAPAAFASTQFVPWVTSHLDVGPALAELLGIDEGRQSEQGLPLWDPGLKKRVTYFFGRESIGADGYHSNGRYFMWNRTSKAVYTADRLHFSAADRVPKGSAAELEVPASIIKMIALSEAWVDKNGRQAR